MPPVLSRQAVWRVALARFGFPLSPALSPLREGFYPLIGLRQ